MHDFIVAWINAIAICKVVHNKGRGKVLKVEVKNDTFLNLCDDMVELGFVITESFNRNVYMSNTREGLGAVVTIV